MTATINQHVGFKGIFHLKFTNVKTGESRELEFNNLILNSGLDRMAAGTFIAGCVLGSASSTPVATDTSIASILGSSITLQASGLGTANTSTTPYWCSYYWTYRFIEGVATGNISQVAMAYGSVSAGTALFSLALVKDSGGTPITITKLADEVLDVTYILQLYCPTSDVTGTIAISGVNYDYIVRPSEAASWRASNDLSAIWLVGVCTGNVGTQLSTPSGSGEYNASTPTLASYTTGSFTRDLAIAWDLNQGNLSGGIQSIIVATGVGGGTRWQIQYNRTSDSAKIPKDATKRLTLNVRFSWGRV
jgi:hypothetical protein